VTRWHLWLGSGIKRPRCEVCGTRRLVFRYTDGRADVWVCRRHRHIVPDGQDQADAGPAS
jgi:hypothetical protein